MAKRSSRSRSRGRSSMKSPKSPATFKKGRFAANVAGGYMSGGYAGAAVAGLRDYRNQRKESRIASRQAAGMQESDVAGRSSRFYKKMRKHKVPKGYKFIGPKLSYQVNNAGGFNVAANVQGWVDFQLGDAQDIVNCGVIASRQLQYIANGTTFAGNLNPYTKLWVESMSMELIWANSTTTAQRITIYDLLLTRDIPFGQTPLTYMTPTGGGTINSYDAANDISGDVTSITTPGVGPFDGAALRGKWKIGKAKQFWLAPGEVHTHKITLNLKKFVFLQPYSDSQMQMQKGCGMTSLWRYMSAPVTGAVSGTNVGASALRYYRINRYKFRFGTQQGPHYECLNNSSALSGAEIYVDEAVAEVFTQAIGFGTSVTA